MNCYNLPSNIRRDSNREPFLTSRQAADALGLQYWKVQRAVKRGLVPSYSFFNKRRLVLVSEIAAYIEATRAGGF